MVEHQLPKLNTRVRFSSPALERDPCNCRGFVVPGAKRKLARIRDVAQMLHMPIPAGSAGHARQDEERLVVAERERLHDLDVVEQEPHAVARRRSRRAAKLNSGPNVLRRQLREIGDNLLGGHPRSEVLEHVVDRDARSDEARLAAAHTGAGLGDVRTGSTAFRAESIQ